jgi:hypothetical protein
MRLAWSIVVVVSLILQTAAIAETAPQPAPAAIIVPDLTDAELHTWIAKSNAYVGLLNGSMRAVESLQRYQSWVDMKTGPTGNERYISYGLYSLSPEQATQVIARARAAADGPPPIAPLDAAAADYAATFDALVPLLNEAAAYYQRQDYKDDKMAGGKALHARIVPAMNAFFAARERLEDGQEALSDGLDRQGLGHIERAEGKSAHWHIRHLAITAKAALHAMPRNARVADLTGFGTAVAAYAEAVRDFDAFNAASGNTEQSRPRDLLARFRTLRDKIEKKDASHADFENVVNQYNTLVDVLNSYR